MDSINDILSSLTPDDINSLKEMADSLFGGSQGEEKAEETSSPFQGIDPSMIMKISSVMGALENNDSKRARLIEALKPNLSHDKQIKADKALQLLKILDLLPLLKEFGFGDNNGIL